MLLALGVAEFLFRGVLYCRYSPQPSVSDPLLPSCTVIVPAYNEGRMVHKTLRSLLQSDYPADKLQILAVDDGSVDDTWAWMETAAREAAGRVEILRLPVNSGKRRALYEGFVRAAGEVLVTVDSDSVVMRDTLRNLTSPFARDPQTGAVAGNVRVLNLGDGLIPRMLDVSFAFSFEFVRASQSVAGTVLCTPGALSAYRKSAVTSVLHLWMAQTFLGRPARIGEDRAMTNLILRNGHHVLLQSNALVHTNVPTRFRGLAKMFLRWARSNVRESLVTASFIFSRFRRTPAAAGRAHFLLCALNLLLAPVLLGVLLFCLALNPLSYLLPLAIAAAASGCVPALFFAWRRHSAAAGWGILYALFWVVALSWITPYAMATAANSSWLTRERTPAADTGRRRRGWGLPGLGLPRPGVAPRAAVKVNP
jgi:hyaluronan synthase